MAHLTIKGIADELEVTKQAVLYWFPTVYLLPQLERSARELVDPEIAAERVYPKTSEFYSALEGKLADAPGLPEHVDPRNLAVSLHMALVGHICMAGQMEALEESFEQGFEELLGAFCNSARRCLENGSETNSASQNSEYM